jgi:hypothetical protein
MNNRIQELLDCGASASMWENLLQKLDDGIQKDLVYALSQALFECDRIHQQKYKLSQRLTETFIPQAKKLIRESSRPNVFTDADIWNVADALAFKRTHSAQDVIDRRISSSNYRTLESVLNDD